MTIEGYKAIVGFLEGVRDVHNVPESLATEMVADARRLGRTVTIGTYVAVGLISLGIFWPITIVPVGILMYTNSRSYMMKRERERRYAEIGEY